MLGSSHESENQANAEDQEIGPRQESKNVAVSEVLQEAGRLYGYLDL